MQRCVLSIYNCLVAHRRGRGFSVARYSSNEILSTNSCPGGKASPTPGSRMIEHFVLESAHRGPYTAGTVSPMQRLKTVITVVDNMLGCFDKQNKTSRDGSVWSVPRFVSILFFLANIAIIEVLCFLAGAVDRYDPAQYFFVGSDGSCDASKCFRQ